MNRRYQVFVSSTYLDLKDERREVMQTLLEMECIPAGMELFPAADDDAWELIKSVINQSDYYLVVVGGKYGSIDNTGISYTEKEYDYALSQGIPVAAFLHESPSKISVEHSELNHDAREKLERFRGKLKENHHCKYWQSSDDLGGKVAKSMNLFFRSKPRIGWIKADSLPQEVVERIQAYKDRIEELEIEIERMTVEAPEGIEDLESGSDEFSFSLNIRVEEKEELKAVEVRTSWDELFTSVGPSLEDGISEQSYRSQLAQAGKRIYQKNRSRIKISTATIGVEAFQTIKYQFMTLGLVTKYQSDDYQRSIHWSLTRFGQHKLAKSLVRKKV